MVGSSRGARNRERGNSDSGVRDGVAAVPVVGVDVRLART